MHISAPFGYRVTALHICGHAQSSNCSYLIVQFEGYTIVDQWDFCSVYHLPDELVFTNWEIG